MRLLTGLTLCLSIFIASVNCDTFDECKNAPSNSFVPSSKGCAYYIYCNGQNSFEDICPDNLMFNADESVCDNPNNVNCSPTTSETSIIPTSTTSTTETTTTAATTTAATTTAATTTATTTTTTATTPINTSWPPASSISSTTVDPPSTLIPTTSPNGEIVCPQPSRPDEVIYLPSPDSCTDYYMCYRLIPIPMTCPIDLEFNSLTGSCDWPQVANCVISGTTTTSPREVCTSGFSGYFAYPTNCHYYYRCMNGLLTIQECPVNYGWDVSRKMCTNTACSS